MKRSTHRKDGSFRAGNKAHGLPPGERRVVLPAQRVARQALATLRAMAPQHGGIGRAIDALANGARPGPQNTPAQTPEGPQAP